MYTEIELIDNVADKKTRVELLLVFIVEYSGWLHHLNNVGLKWGASGEEVGANKEAIRAKAHIELLQNKILELM